MDSIADPRKEHIDIIDVDADAESVDVDTCGEIIDLKRCYEVMNSRDDDEQKVAPSKGMNERRKRRRRIRRLLKARKTPSFVALISPEQRDAPISEKRLMLINVDEYLGLKTTKVSATNDIYQTYQISDSQQNFAKAATLPSEEGWFEGVMPLALPGEGQYLNELHHLIRANLELFSATALDANTGQPGRRTPTVRGKVGIRCIHCARAILDKLAKSFAPTWPPGSISYPVNIAGLYPVCSQKPLLHFEQCPYIPLDTKVELYRLTHDADGNPKRQQRKSAEGDPRSISTVMYYAVAAKQLGLVDIPGGIRFGRDLTLEPLPMEAVRAQVEVASPETYRRMPTASTIKPFPVANDTPRITADEESERILAEAIAEPDDESFLLGRSDDKCMVSDFVFLCVRQMAICHAVPADFESRGKKTKLMRVGFAGFCCKHCAGNNAASVDSLGNFDFACRSFSSAPDNLASAISNSFYLHLQKCNLVPSRIKGALSVYKRLHSRQIGRLPYGSQRRLFHLLWQRLRAADRSAEQMAEQLKNATRLAKPSLVLSQHNQQSTSIPVQASHLPTTSAESQNISTTPDMAPSATSPQSPDMYPSVFPTCHDEETQRILQAAEQQHPSFNDNLILSSDRHLISDFVFLIMKQLKVAQPTIVDFARGKRSTALHTSHPGLRCIHCMNEDQFVSVTGRSFPSQPDNMASSLNTSLLQHMLKCHFVPEDLKRALANLKKVHSAQCSSLKFGSQRRFFNIVFDRLRQVKVEQGDCEADTVNMQEKSLVTPVQPVPRAADDETLELCAFIRTVGDFFECQRCRMVPFSLRAPGSLSLPRPSNGFVHAHSQICKEDSFDLVYATDLLAGAIKATPSLTLNSLRSQGFRPVLLALMAGNEGLERMFYHLITIVERQHNAEEKVEFDAVNIESKSLWSQFPPVVDFDDVRTAFDTFAHTVQGLTPTLEVNKDLFRFFQVISPSLVVKGQSRQVAGVST